MNKIGRRDFLKGSLACSAAFGLPLARVRGANDDIRVAMVGLFKILFLVFNVVPYVALLIVG